MSRELISDAQSVSPSCFLVTAVAKNFSSWLLVNIFNDLVVIKGDAIPWTPTWGDFRPGDCGVAGVWLCFTATFQTFQQPEQLQGLTNEGEYFHKMGYTCVLGSLLHWHKFRMDLLYTDHIPGRTGFSFCCWSGLKSLSLPKMKPHTSLHATVLL